MMVGGLVHEEEFLDQGSIILVEPLTIYIWLVEMVLCFKFLIKNSASAAVIIRN